MCSTVVRKLSRPAALSLTSSRLKKCDGSVSSSVSDWWFFTPALSVTALGERMRMRKAFCRRQLMASLRNRMSVTATRSQRVSSMESPASCAGPQSRSLSP